VAVREVNRTQAHAQVDPVDVRWLLVPSLAGLVPGVLVRATQDGGPAPSYLVVADTDPVLSRVLLDPPPAGTDPDRPVLLQTVDYRLVVSERGRLLRVYDGLSVVPHHPRYAPNVLAPLRSTGTVASPEPVVVRVLPRVPAPWSPLRPEDGSVRLTGGRDGLASLAAGDFVGEPFAPDDSEEARAVKRRGLRAVEELDEVALLAVPDIHIRPLEPHPVVPPPPCVPDPCRDEAAPAGPPPPLDLPAELPPVFGPTDVYLVQAQMVLQCERLRDRFALLDAPYDEALDAVSGIRGVLDWRGRFDTSYAALAYPWLKVSDLVAGPGDVRLVPLSGHVAGVVAATDIERGVHHAPANRPIEWSLGPSVMVSEERHAVLNRAGVNVARTVGGRGLRLLGARTLSADPDWRFVNVRRLMSMIEEALEIALQWAVFEPNGFLTRARATMTVTFFLDALHEAGMLAGATPEESFYVRCDLDNNPADTRDLGELVIEVGVAPAQPFEFVVLRVGRVRDSLEVRSGPASLGATGTGV
jgi:hypothetical protein